MELATNIIVDKERNVYITGFFSETVDFDPGAGTYTLTTAEESSSFICKVDSNGKFIAARQLGKGIGLCFASDLEDNIYNGGRYSSPSTHTPNAPILGNGNNNYQDAYFVKIGLPVVTGEKETDLASHGASYRISPNPVQNEFYVYTEDAKLPCQYTLFDAFGKNVGGGILQTSTSFINISVLPAGIYYLHMDDKTAQALKVVKR